MNTSSRSLCAAAMLLATFTQIASADTQTDIIGSWSSVGCELRPQQNPDGSIGQWWLTRAIDFEEGRIDATFTTYADAGCQTTLHELHFAGSVEFGDASELAPGAREAKLTIDEFVRFTPRADGFRDFLNSAEPGACGNSTWELGKAQDVLKTGCNLLGLQPDSPTIEYEVLAVVGNQLYFAARPVDGSFMTSPDKRVYALQVGLRRN